MIEPVTEDYVKLSLRAGVIGGVISRVLKDDAAIHMFRACRWDLTNEMIEAAKRGALAKGMPQKELDDAEAMVAELVGHSEFLRFATGLQNKVDAMYDAYDDAYGKGEDDVSESTSE